MFFAVLQQGIPAAIASFAIAKNRHVAVSKQTLGKVHNYVEMDF